MGLQTLGMGCASASRLQPAKLAPTLQPIGRLPPCLLLPPATCRGAVEFAEAHIRRLLSGRVTLWELAMTGGLWRVTGQQVAEAAAGGAEEGSVAAAAGADAEEMRGPHAALAVRLAQRDPGRAFVLGEHRIAQGSCSLDFRANTRGCGAGHTLCYRPPFCAYPRLLRHLLQP